MLKEDRIEYLIADLEPRWTGWSLEERRVWLKEKNGEIRRDVLRYAYAGPKSWASFLRRYKLREVITITDL